MKYLAIILIHFSTGKTVASWNNSQLFASNLSEINQNDRVIGGVNTIISKFPWQLNLRRSRKYVPFALDLDRLSFKSLLDKIYKYFNCTRDNMNKSSNFFHWILKYLQCLHKSSYCFSKAFLSGILINRSNKINRNIGITLKLISFVSLITLNFDFQ